MKSEKVSTNIVFQGTLDTVCFISSFTSISCVGGGAIRSRLTLKVMIKNTNAMAAKMPMVQIHPCCRFWPSFPKWSTKGSVIPCTTNCAIVTATKRIVVIFSQQQVRGVLRNLICQPSHILPDRMVDRCLSLLELWQTAQNFLFSFGSLLIPFAQFTVLAHHEIDAQLVLILQKRRIRV